ncbi:MAG: S41 family peptidase, partial [Polyangiaceae bacterium]
DADAWSKVVLAAAVRAYVPLVDPHGAWAPLDEESSVYAVDLDAHPPQPLWDKVVRTAAGVRVESGAIAPLRNGDVVVELDHMFLAGLSLEQVDQLGIVSAESHALVDARVFRDGEQALVAIRIDTTPKVGSDDDARDDLQAHRVAYGDADVGVVAIREVRDDLGEGLAHVVHKLRNEGPPLAGLILDLRGNGGGSTEGASAAIGMFLPEAELFPLKRRDGTIESEASPPPPEGEAWTGPLATLVDGSTASAAEMISGALASYRRAPTVGRQTYGKGCAQEYEDDDPHTGVLRLTTLLYALPDGAAVQRIGLTPMVHVPFTPLPGEDDTTESEAKLEGAPPTWKGPDMRSQEILERITRSNVITWPAATGATRPCEDADVCKALRALAPPAKSSRVAKSR